MVLYGETKDVHATSSWPNELERGLFFAEQDYL